MTTERMVAAHKAGRAYAAETFAAACSKAMDSDSDQEAQFAFIAGFVAELRRLLRIIAKARGNEIESGARKPQGAS